MLLAAGGRHLDAVLDAPAVESVKGELQAAVDRALTEGSVVGLDAAGVHRGHPRGPGDVAVPRRAGDVGPGRGDERVLGRARGARDRGADRRRVLPRRAGDQPPDVLPLDRHRADLHRGRPRCPARSTSSSRSAGSPSGPGRRSTSRPSCPTRRSPAPRRASRSSSASSCGRCSATPRSRSDHASPSGWRTWSSCSPCSCGPSRRRRRSAAAVAPDSERRRPEAVRAGTAASGGSARGDQPQELAARGPSGRPRRRRPSRSS